VAVRPQAALTAPGGTDSEVGMVQRDGAAAGTAQGATTPLPGSARRPGGADGPVARVTTRGGRDDTGGVGARVSAKSHLPWGRVSGAPGRLFPLPDTPATPRRRLTR